MKKICFIAPGEIQIPPNGWGALETVVWNQYLQLKNLGYDVYIINSKEKSEVISDVAKIKPDIIHLHYGAHYDLMPMFSCRKIITNHDGSFINSQPFHEKLVRSFFYDCEFFILTQWEKEFLLKIGISPKNIKILPNGVDCLSFKVDEEPKFKDKTICLGKIDKRKNQAFLQGLDCNIDFVGQNTCSDFNPLKENFLGMWTRDEVFSRLTNYCNLTLISESELQPLVCLEALCCGLGLAISESSTQNLDTSLPFITVIPQERIKDKDFVKQQILKNRENCLEVGREKIVEYGKSFSWFEIAKKYKTYL